METKLDPQLDIKVQSYLGKLFEQAGTNRQLADLREEMAANLTEKVSDYRTRGMDEDQAFREAIVSMGDMGKLIDEVRQSSLTETSASAVPSFSRWPAAGIITGVLLALFGIFVSIIVFMNNEPDANAAGPGIMVVGGCALITYSWLLRKPTGPYSKRMKHLRASLYALSVASLLFGGYLAMILRVGTGDFRTAVGPLMVTSLAGAGLLLTLLFTRRGS